jgi:hypothetical protein
MEVANKSSYQCYLKSQTLIFIKICIARSKQYNLSYCFFILINCGFQHLTTSRNNPQVHHRIYNNPLPAPILSQLNPLHTPSPSNLPKIHSDPILPSTPWSSEWSPSFGVSRQNIVYFPPLSHACRKPCPSHSP